MLGDGDGCVGGIVGASPEGQHLDALIHKRQFQ